jgi:HAE1 family hydrophobic/amphiphilic exporter-1
MVALVVVGVIAYTSMPLDFFPEVSYPAMAVITIYPGASPSEVQTQVTRLIEEAMMTAPGVQDVQAASSESLSMVVVMFSLDTNVDQALQDVRNKIANVRSQLPDDVLEPSVINYDPSAVPILSISAAAQANGGTAENIRQTVTDDILPRFQRIDGVADATVTGGREREIQVLLDASALKARHLAPQQVVQTVVAESYSIPGGSIQQQGQNLLLRTPGNFNRVEDIANLQIASPLGAVRVGDVAVVQDGWKEQDTFSRLGGQEAVVIAVRKQSGTNTVQVAERVKEELMHLRQERPDLNLAVVRDQSIFVEESFNDAMRELIIGAVMASLVVLLFFRNLRNTLVTVAGLPFIVLGTFAVMKALGMTLNIVSLLALALSVGLVIDDAIVVRENIFRHMEAGESPKEASRRGTGEVALPVLAMSLTIVSVFIPIAFVGGLVGRFMNSFGVVVSVAVLISLFEAMTFAPMLSAYLFKQKKGKQVVTAEEFHVAEHGAMGWLDRFYGRVLGWTLRFKFVTLVVSIAIFAAAVYGATFLKPAFMPATDQGSLTMGLALPPGTSLTQTDQATRNLEARLLAYPEIQTVLATIGGRGTPEQANLYIQLKPGQRTEAFAAQARAQLTGVPGLTINMPTFTSMAAGGGSSSVLGRPVQISLQTIGSADELNEFALDLAEQLKQVPGLVDIDVSYKPGKPEAQIMVDRRKAADLGINAATVGGTVRMLVEGDKVANFRGEGPEADIRVQLREEDRQRLEQVLELQVPTSRGFVPLRQVAHIELSTGPTQIARINRQNSVVIGASAFGRVQSDVVADATKLIEGVTLPQGVTYSFTGEQEMQEEAFSNLLIAMLLAVVFIYMVLASQFGSFIQPLIIMLALPLAVIGGLLALLVFRLELDMTAMIGLILLMGLVTKNSILLVDLTNRLRREKGMARDEALKIAGPIRLRPILMTTLALILGMLPVAIGLGSGGDFRRSMAVTVIGGLITSTLLTLVIVPTAYSLVEGALARARARLDARRAAQEARAAEAARKEEAASAA